MTAVSVRKASGPGVLGKVAVLANGVLTALLSARLSILIFHRVHAEPDSIFPGEPDAHRFKALMALLGKSFNFCSLDDAVRGLRDGTLRKGSLAVTFDDGYVDNLDVACPILLALGIPATFFVASGFMRGGRMWNDRIVEAVRHCDADVTEIERALASTPGAGTAVKGARTKRDLCLRVLAGIKYLPETERNQAVGHVERCLGMTQTDALMMNEDQVRKLRSHGMTIGAHTVNHPILRTLDEASARSEIEQGKADLERVLGEEISLFAYPNGKPGADYCARDVRLVTEAGFTSAVTTEWGVSSVGDDLLQLPRFTPWDRDMWRFSLRLSGNLLRRNYARATA